jgi:hypothetical protein
VGVGVEGYGWCLIHLGGEAIVKADYDEGPYEKGGLSADLPL